MKIAHALAAAEAAGLPATVFASFIDQRIDELLGIDGRREATLALVTLGAAATPAGPPPAATIPPLPAAPTPLSPKPFDYPEALRYHTASTLANPDEVRTVRTAALPPGRAPVPTDMQRPLPAPAGARTDPSLDAVVRSRRSTRRFAQRPISVDELASVLALPGAGAPADFLVAQPTLLETYVIVNAVDGIAPGAYYYDCDAHTLALLESGDLRRVAGFLSLGQALPRDASAVIYYLANLDAIADVFGERSYRLAELEAGLVAGRAYLAAYAIGRGATGLTFFDEEVTRFFSPHAIELEPLLVMAVGVPARR